MTENVVSFPIVDYSVSSKVTNGRVLYTPKQKHLFCLDELVMSIPDQTTYMNWEASGT